MRKIARSSRNEPGIEEWSEDVIPPLVQAFQNQTREGEGSDELVDKVLLEDSRGFSIEDQSDVRRIPPGGPGGDEDVDDPNTDTAADDERWHRLKQATLADIAELEDDDMPPPPPGMKSVPPGNFYRPGQQDTQPTAPPQPAIEEEPARGGSGMVIGALLGGALLLLLGVVVVGAVAVTVLTNTSTSVASDTTTTAVADTTPKDTPKTVTGPAARFVSGLPNTKKITVTCDNGEGSGETAADVAGEKLGKCTVTAIDTKRSRVTTVVDDVKTKTYVCFDAGSKECK